VPVFIHLSGLLRIQLWTALGNCSGKRFADSSKSAFLQMNKFCDELEIECVICAVVDRLADVIVLVLAPHATGRNQARTTEDFHKITGRGWPPKRKPY
jgi:hypothetical protein